METFSTLLAFCSGNHRSMVNSQYKGQWRGALMFFFYLRLNQQLNKQWRCQWFGMPSCSLCQYNAFDLSLLYRDWSLPSHPHNWTVFASRAIVMQIKLYCRSKSSGAYSLCWLRCSRGKHGKCRGHSTVKWSARWEPPSQIPLISEHALFDLYGETH